MATTAKEYSMLFKLSASLGKEFQGTFSSAQKALTETQREIQELNKMQSDISAYERQQQAVENTARKLADLQKEYDNIQREIQETEGFSSSLENKLIEKQRAIDNTSASLDKQTAKLDQMGNELREAGVDTDNLAGKSKELAQKQKELAEQNLKAADAAKSYGVESVNAFETVGSALVAAGILKGLKEIYGAYKECVSISMEFGETMSAVEAISGASADEIEVLTARAKELGATTKFTATESAQAMTYMAMAGWDATEMVSGMDGVMQLAAASGEDLASVSDIVTDNLTAFGLQASDTAHFADVLAAAATNSNTSVGIMGETFKNCAPLAGALGYSVEDVAVAIGLMANAGIKGSNAGTALKNIFNGLLGEITLTSGAFGEVTYSAVKSDGTMKSFSETLADLRVYFSQMTGAEKMANAEALVGQRAMAGFVQLMNSAGDDVDKLTESINNCSGAAEKMANIRLDNLSGQVTLLNSAADGLKTTIGEAFEPELREIAELGTDILGDINSFLSANPVLTKTILGIVGALGLLTAGYLAYSFIKKTMQTLNAAYVVLQDRENKIIKENSAALADNTLAIGANAVAKKASMAVTTQNTAAVAKGVGASVGASGILTKALSALKGAFAGVSAGAVATVGVIGAFVAAYAYAIYRGLRVCQDYYDEATADTKAFAEEVEVYKESISSIKDEYAQSIGENETISEQAQSYIQRLKELESQEQLSSEQQAEYNVLIEELKELFPGLNVQLDGYTGRIKGGTTALEEQIKIQEQQIRLEATKNLAAQYEEKRLKLQLEYNHALSKQKELEDTYNRQHSKINSSSYAAQVSTAISYSSVDTIQIPDTLLQDTIEEKVDEAAVIAQQALTDEAKELLDQADAELVEIWQEYANLEEVVKSAMDTVDGSNDSFAGTTITLEDVASELQNVQAAYIDVYNAAYDSISGQYNLWDTAAVVIPTDIKTINTALETQTSYWSDYNNDLSSLLARTDDIEGLSDVIASFADGSTDSVNAIAGMAAATDDDLRIMVANWHSVQAMQEEAAAAVANIDVMGELEDVQADFEEAIDNMDLSDPARIAAENTMNAYVEALRAGTYDAVEAAGNISNLVSQALEGHIIVTPRGGGGNGSRTAYADGTDYASPGWALVGENGPELAYMHGGEHVFDARDTARILGGGSSTAITISPVINVTGGGDAGDIMDAVREQLVPAVLDALDEKGIDARRNMYS